MVAARQVFCVMHQLADFSVGSKRANIGIHHHFFLPKEAGATMMRGHRPSMILTTISTAVSVSLPTCLALGLNEARLVAHLAFLTSRLASRFAFFSCFLLA